jgi:hypothetical protein
VEITDEIIQVKIANGACHCERKKILTKEKCNILKDNWRAKKKKKKQKKKKKKKKKKKEEEAAAAEENVIIIMTQEEV